MAGFRIALAGGRDILPTFSVPLMTDATRSTAAAVACPWTFSRSARSSETRREMSYECCNYRRFDPGLEPIALPALRPDQHNPGRLESYPLPVVCIALSVGHIRPLGS